MVACFKVHLSKQCKTSPEACSFSSISHGPVPKSCSLAAGQNYQEMSLQRLNSASLPQVDLHRLKRKVKCNMELLEAEDKMTITERSPAISGNLKSARNDIETSI